MSRPIVLAALLALPLPATAQTAAGAYGVTAAATAFEPDLRMREETPAAETPRTAKPEDQAAKLAAAAFRPGATPAKPQEEPLEFEVRPPDGYDQIEEFQLKGAKIAYARRF